MPNAHTFQIKMQPFCAVSKIVCDPKYPYRTIDGSCNNLFKPRQGKAMTAQIRVLSPSYGDSK